MKLNIGLEALCQHNPISLSDSHHRRSVGT